MMPKLDKQLVKEQTTIDIKEHYTCTCTCLYVHVHVYELTYHLLMHLSTYSYTPRSNLHKTRNTQTPLQFYSNNSGQH